jgi:hypothetical protein
MPESESPQPPSKRLASEKQIAANRANAARSTGPRTPEGKASSSQNSRKHGFAASSFTVVRLEDIDEVAHLRADLVAAYQPVNSQELFALERMAICQQAILRAARLESGLFTTCMDESFGPNGAPRLPLEDELTRDIKVTCALNRNFLFADGFRILARQGNSITLFLRYQAQAERQYRRAVEEYERVKKLRPELPNDPILADDLPAEPEENTATPSSPEPIPNEPISPCGAGAPVSGSAPDSAPPPPFGAPPEPPALSEPRPSGAAKKSVGRRKCLPHQDGTRRTARWDRRFRLSTLGFQRFFHASSGSGHAPQSPTPSPQSPIPSP